MNDSAILKALEAFSQQAIDGALNIFLALQQRGISLEDFMSFVRRVPNAQRYRDDLLKQEALSQLGQDCPNCVGRWLEPTPINEPKGRSNLKGYTTIWYCDQCGYEKFTSEENENGSR